jgi:hypothetical protein
MVDLFFNKELADISFEVEALDDWKKTCEELGLENQLTLTKGKESPVSYPFMNTTMVRVYETLCPRKVGFKDYKVTPIPLEVLKQIAFSVKEKHFEEIQIWYDDKSPDPVVVGLTGYWCAYNNDSNAIKDDKGNYKRFKNLDEIKKYKNENGISESTHNWFNKEGEYLMARWGDELRDFSELKKLAVERFIDNVGGEMKKEAKILTEKINCLKENAVSYMNGNTSVYDATGSHSLPF